MENKILNNGRDGVNVFRASHADVANNQIDENGRNGISVSQNSAVNLGRDSGTDADDLPNSTTTDNQGFGVRCRLNSSADGRLGSLAGASGNKDFGRTFRVRLDDTVAGSDDIWGSVNDTDGTGLIVQTISGVIPGSVNINQYGCVDSLM